MSEQLAGGEKTTLRKEVHAMLRLHDATSMNGSLGRFLKGLGVCLAGGIVLATLLDVFFNGLGIGWWGCFLGYLIVLTGLLIWQERRTVKDYLSGPLQVIDLNLPASEQRRSGPLSPQMRKVVSTIFWGPLAMIDGFRGLRGQRSPLQEAAFDRAAVIVLDLTKVDGGVEIKELLNPPEDMPIFGSAVDLLSTHGWIGKSSDGRSMWLDSYHRKKLAEKRLTPGTRAPRRA
jgi:hypothetical protein